MYDPVDKINNKDTKTNMNFEHIDTSILQQVKSACQLIDKHLGEILNSIYLYGSTLHGGLKPLSDIDLLVTVDTPLSEQQRQQLMSELLTVSAWPGSDPKQRALEVTVLLNESVKKWHYPPRRELQFGEWLRDDIVSGIFEPPQIDPDIAILLTKVHQHSIAILGNDAAHSFPPIPFSDLSKALKATLEQWNVQDDWEHDECNIILALARILYTLSTQKIASKSEAADWLLHRINTPSHYQLLSAAQRTYLTGETFDVSNSKAIEDFILTIKSQCEERLAK
ncbi:DUF4111 domain-containing protein [Providencia stuartii]|nr:ANT(3'') family aminoglycoside nucleotidyltransferase [Providencia stuartii]QPN38694.1 DUF4111 domain-containing protein [Providencia sp. 2.29]MBN5555832.1 DUF4111 domain-containing protein [Providencia stuartii]MBQ0456538.1 DUF4111 domain-containing protein [Providencia stuartii]MBQ0694838.1 DUF4111 domain-containing protein [Providencia stuartii]